MEELRQQCHVNGSILPLFYMNNYNMQMIQTAPVEIFDNDLLDDDIQLGPTTNTQNYVVLNKEVAGVAPVQLPNISNTTAFQIVDNTLVGNNVQFVNIGQSADNMGFVVIQPQMLGETQYVKSTGTEVPSHTDKNSSYSVLQPEIVPEGCGSSMQGPKQSTDGNISDDTDDVVIIKEENIGRKRKHKNMNQQSPQNFTCFSCDKIFATAKTLQAHLKCHTVINCSSTQKAGPGDNVTILKEGGMVCTLCKSSTVNKSEMKESISAGVPFICYKCVRSQLRKESIDKISKGGKSYDCDVCGEVFGLFSDLTRHSRIHIPEHVHKRERFRCEVCGLTLYSYVKFKQHFKKHCR